MAVEVLEKLRSSPTVSGSAGEGVAGWAGVVAMEDSAETLLEVVLELNWGSLSRCCAAASAASVREMADPFFCEDLKENLGFGPIFARVSESCSVKPRIALKTCQFNI